MDTEVEEMRRSYKIFMILTLFMILVFFTTSVSADMQKGDTGEDVGDLQQMLFETGFFFYEIDGVFGNLTEQSVMDYQEFAKLPVTGIVDEYTWSALMETWYQVMDEMYAQDDVRYFAPVADGARDYDELLQIIAASESYETYNNPGYSIQDISGDGEYELLIGSIETTDGASGSGNEIYALYTWRDGKPYFSFEGWSRNSYRYMGNGEFLYQGSEGAMYSMFGVYSIAPDGTNLICKDYYFTFEKDESFSEIGFYHNTTGEWNKSVSDELTMTGEEFWQMEAELEKKLQI